mgnify:CR=1 FL=1
MFLIIGHAWSLSWPEGSHSITIEDFHSRSGELWTCGMHSGHVSFSGLERQYFFENTDQTAANGRILGLFHSVTLDQGTLIAQGFEIRRIHKGAAHLRRAYVTDDGVDFPQFVGDSVSIPIKISEDGQHMYPGTFKDVEGEFRVGILDCIYADDQKPAWAK